ncbi:hypothetical protein [Streptomyces agglomeratus]|uniref:hypothetical protein n=1 Tax=Streptomyces agglomeratus TaxID=285458 RepID=UPI00114CFCBD|nr:hypothetical protein [Streptomyces agglomeratus]
MSRMSSKLLRGAWPGSTMRGQPAYAGRSLPLIGTTPSALRAPGRPPALETSGAPPGAAPAAPALP